MGMSFGNKNFRMSFTKNGIGWSAGTKGFRFSHRANSKSSGGLGTLFYWLCILLPWYCIKYTCILMWYVILGCTYYPVKGCIWLYRKIRAKILARKSSL